MLSLISTITSSSPLLYSPRPELSLVVAAFFPAVVLAALSVLMSDIWVDSLCGPGLADQRAALQVGLTGVVWMGTLRPGCPCFLGLASLPGSAEHQEVYQGCPCVVAAGRAKTKWDLLGPQRDNSQEMQLGARSWGPTEVNDSSLLDQLETVMVISSQTQFRHLQTKLESLWLKSHP